MSLPLTGSGKSRGEILTGYAVVFNGTNSFIDCGSDATLDDIPSGATITVHGWVRLDAETTGVVVMKGLFGTSGWSFYFDSANHRLTFRVELATADALSVWDISGVTADGKWHHFCGYYDDTAKASRVAWDGQWDSVAVGIGAYQSDAARTLTIASTSGSLWMDGAVAWVEVWNNDHLTAGTNFTPPRTPTAAGPVNLIESWPMNEGAGVTVVASVTAPANNGTIANGSWATL